MSAVPVMSSNPATQLCDYCHQKPKFSNHSYCSKTCAGQAATLCNQCHKKPKFQNFDYCGKNCAALANATGSNARNPVVPTVQPTYPKANNNQKNQQPAFDPLQLAKLVAQHIPQVQALLNPNGSAPAYTSAPASQPIVANPFNGPSAQVIPPPNIQNAPAPAAPAGPLNNPFLNHNPGPLAQAPAVQTQAQQPQTGPAFTGNMNAVTNGAVNLGASSNLLPGTQQLHIISTQQSPPDTECLIPGCGQPVHVDAKGVKASSYCSMRHREEAVTSGLVSPCIMCLVMPQNDDDYFCSRACREESLNKHLVYVAESECE